MEKIDMITNIESSSNIIYKNTKKLLASKGRSKFGMFITEGARSVFDAAKNNASIEYIILSANYNGDIPKVGCRVYRMQQSLFEDISSTVNSQGIIAVVNQLDLTIDRLDLKMAKRIVYLDSVTDPGNMGTILRTSDAMGVDAVILSKGCVDIYNPKVVRSTMASIFNVPVYSDENGSALKALSDSGFAVCGTFVDGDTACYDADLSGRTVIVMGNEANGICTNAEKMCRTRLSVPMYGGAESLNVAVCCGMILYEQVRQINQKGGMSHG